MVGAVILPFPLIVNGSPLYEARPSDLTARSLAMASQCFFLGLSWLSGSPGYEGHMTRSPITAPAGTSRVSTLSGDDAHMIIPSERTPLIFAGLRFKRNTPTLPCISSSV